MSDKFGATSEQAVQAAKKAADLKDRIGDAKALTDSFNPDAKFKGLAQSLGAVAGGFSAVQGAMGLLGSNSKELEQTMLKVQSAMALSQGLNSLGEAQDAFKNLSANVKNSTLFIKANEMANKATAASMKLFGFSVESTATSFKVLKGAIAATGIGLLIIAIGELVSAFQAYEGAAEKAKKKQEDLNASIKKGAKIAIDTETAYLENSRKIDVATAKARGASEQEIFDIEQRYKKLKIESTKRYNKEVANINAEEDISNQRNLVSQQTDLEVSALDFQTKQNDNQKAANKQSAEERKKHNDEAVKLAKEAADKELEIEKKKQEQIAEVQRLTLESKRKIAEIGKTEQEKESLQLDFKYDDELKKLEGNRIAQRELDLWYQSELIRIKAEAEQKEKERQDESLKKIEEQAPIRAAKQLEQLDADQKKKTENYRSWKEAEVEATRQLEDAKFAAVEAGLNMLGVLAGKNEKLANIIFVAEKAMAIAKIVVDTQREIAGYWANPLWSAFPDGGISVKTSASLGAKIRAGVGIATIAATTISKFKGGGGAGAAGGGGGGSAPSVSAPMQPQMPQASTTNLSQSSINALGNQAVKAYVVETDMTTNQQRIKAIQQRARFG